MFCRDKLQCSVVVVAVEVLVVMVVVARVVSGTNMFDRGLSLLPHFKLHWLNVREPVAYKLSIMVYSCMHGQAPQYRMDFCHPTSSFTSRQQL